ncbi:MAG TPA: hypothetical protein VIO61_05760 [Anaerolineaceae bacterium]
MITKARIEDWIRQVEAMPVAAPLIIRQMAERIIELDALNEKLRAENLQLEIGNRVKEYEKRINELEFQLSMLKRQLSSGEPQKEARFTLLLSNEKGQVLRADLDSAQLEDGAIITSLKGDPLGEAYSFQILCASPYEQILYLFSSGRTATAALDSLPPSDLNSLSWQGASLEEPRALEELVALSAVARMSWYDCCVQLTRFGFARRISMNYLKTFITNNNVGKGTRYDFDRTFRLVLANPTDTLALAMKKGALFSQAVSGLPVSPTELVHPRAGDYLTSAFTITPDQSLVAITREGIAYVQPGEWLIPENGQDHRTRRLFPEKDEEQQVIGAAAVSKEDWGFIFREDGSLMSFKISSLTNRRPIPISSSGKSASGVLAFSVYSPSNVTR